MSTIDTRSQATELSEALADIIAGASNTAGAQIQQQTDTQQGQGSEQR